MKLTEGVQAICRRLGSLATSSTIPHKPLRELLRHLFLPFHAAPTSGHSSMSNVFKVRSVEELTGKLDIDFET